MSGIRAIRGKKVRAFMQESTCQAPNLLKGMIIVLTLEGVP